MNILHSCSFPEAKNVVVCYSPAEFRFHGF